MGCKHGSRDTVHIDGLCGLAVQIVEALLPAAPVRAIHAESDIESIAQTGECLGARFRFRLAKAKGQNCGVGTFRERDLPRQRGIAIIGTLILGIETAVLQQLGIAIGLPGKASRSLGPRK